MRTTFRRCFTLIEILVVLTIIIILTTLVVGGGQAAAEKANEAQTRALISDLEIACDKFYSVNGYYPPTSADDGGLVANSGHCFGSLYYYLTDPQFGGPFTSFSDEQKSTQSATLTLNAIAVPQIFILDAWGNPIYYANAEDYTGGSVAVAKTVETGVQPRLESDIYKNVGTFQLLSAGANGLWYGSTNLSDTDDVTNIK